MAVNLSRFNPADYLLNRRTWRPIADAHTLPAPGRAI